MNCMMDIWICIDLVCDELAVWVKPKELERILSYYPCDFLATLVRRLDHGVPGVKNLELYAASPYG